MQAQTPLFRSAAMAARRPKAAGEIILAAPISFAALAGFAFALASAIVAFFVWGTYTQHSTLRGQLVPDLGVIEARAPQYGIIIDKRVFEGRFVERGEVLYVISSERLSSALGATHELIGRQLAMRRRSLQAQIEETRLLERADRESLQERIAALETELGRLHAMVTDQSDRAALAEEAAARYARMHAQGFVSTEQLVVKREQQLDQRARLGGLERERAQLARQLTDLENQLSSLPLEYRTRVAELERAVAGVDLEATENEARRQVHVVAPARGTATAVTGDVGQVVESGQALVSILPEGATLRAQLFAPSRAVGFVDVGDNVLLRYHAYPYQKFGHYAGRVAAVSRAARAPAQPSGGNGGAGGEPVYDVVVDLSSQAVNVYGVPRALRAGMAVEADVKLETRRLYEWVLEPLYALTEKSGE